MLHVYCEGTQAQVNRTLCGTTPKKNEDNDVVCTVCFDMHKAAEDLARPRINKLIWQYQRGLISAADLGAEAWLTYQDAQMKQIGVES